MSDSSPPPAGDPPYEPTERVPVDEGDESGRELEETLPPGAVEEDDEATIHHRDTRSLAPARLDGAAAPGGRLDEYELIEEIGRGGMGVVYKARQHPIGRIVALKVILAGVHAAAADVARFYYEAQAAGRLDHPNIVTIYEVGEQQGQHFFSMQYVDGPNLAALVAKEPLSGERAARYLKTVAEVMHLAHEAGIVHRDLKPANVLIDARDEPLITDFGLAKIIGEDADLTETGMAIGTPSYMSPEQAAGDKERIGPASDIYSLGAILYALLTGKAPFREQSLLKTLQAVMDEEPAPPRRIRAKCDRELEAICLKCLRKDPRERYATAGELADDLDRYLTGEPVLARPDGTIRRGARWLGGVPAVAALRGRRGGKASPWQRRSQWIAAAAVLAAIAAAAVLYSLPSPPPRVVRIAAGPEAGMYHRVGKALAEEIPGGGIETAIVQRTNGALDNRARLLSGECELAILQADAVNHHDLAVVAPLYYEVLLIVVRRSDEPVDRIEAIEELGRLRVAIGPPDSGTYDTATRLYKFFELPSDRWDTRGAPLDRLADDLRIDAAFVVAGLEHPHLGKLMESGEYRLLAIDKIERIAGRYPNFKSTHVYPADVPRSWSGAIPQEGVGTIMTPAFLVARADAHDLVAQRALAALYAEGRVARKLRIIDRDEAATWTTLPRHPAAERFFDEDP